MQERTRTRSPRRPGSRYLDGAELKRRREAAEISQSALAAAIDEDPNHFPHWEAGHYGCEINVLVKLAGALPDCEPEQLMHDKGKSRYKALMTALSGKAAA